MPLFLYPRLVGYQKAVAVLSAATLVVSCANAQPTNSILPLTRTHLGLSLGTKWLAHSAYVNSVAFLPNAPVLVAVDDDGTACLWDLTRMRRQLLPLTGLTRRQALRCVATSSDGATIVCGGGVTDGIIVSWDVRTLTIKCLTELECGVQCIALAPSGERIAAGCTDGTLRILDSKTFQAVNKIDALSGKDGSVESVSFTASGSHIVVVSSDHKVSLWTIGGERFRSAQLADWHSSAVCSRDGSQVYCCDECDIKRLDEKTLRTTGSHPLRFKPIEIAVSPTGAYVAVQSGDRSLGIFRNHDFSIRQTLTLSPGSTGPIRSISFSACGRYLAAVQGRSDAIRVWELGTGAELNPDRHFGRINDIEFSIDNSGVLTAGDDETVRAWDLNTGRCINTLIDNKTILTLALSADGQQLATAGTGNAVTIWDLRTQRVTRVLDGHGPNVMAVVFDRGTKRVICADESSVRLWSSAGICESCNHAKARVLLANIARDGGLVLQCRVDNPDVIHLYQLPCTREEVRIGDRGAAYSCAALSPSGEWLAAVKKSDGGSQLVIRDMANNQVFPPLSIGTDAEATSLSLAPFGRLVAVGFENGVVRVWEARTGGLARVYSGFAGKVMCLRFSNDGRFLAVAGQESRASVFDLCAYSASTIAAGESISSAIVAELQSANSMVGAAACARLARARIQGNQVATAVLSSIPVPRDGEIARWILELDHSEFAVREAAEANLRKYGIDAKGHLEVERAKLGSPEKRNRINRLLEELRWPYRSLSCISVVRLTQILEELGTSDAKDILSKLSGRAPEHFLTQMSGAALRRLEYRERARRP